MNWIRPVLLLVGMILFVESSPSNNTHRSIGNTSNSLVELEVLKETLRNETESLSKTTEIRAIPDESVDAIDTQNQFDLNSELDQDLYYIKDHVNEDTTSKGTHIDLNPTLNQSKNNSTNHQRLHPAKDGNEKGEHSQIGDSSLGEGSDEGERSPIGDSSEEESSEEGERSPIGDNSGVESSEEGKHSPMGDISGEESSEERGCSPPGEHLGGESSGEREGSGDKSINTKVHQYLIPFDDDSSGDIYETKDGAEIELGSGDQYYVDPFLQFYNYPAEGTDEGSGDYYEMEQSMNHWLAGNKFWISYGSLKKKHTKYDY